MNPESMTFSDRLRARGWEEGLIEGVYKKKSYHEFSNPDNQACWEYINFAKNRFK